MADVVKMMEEVDQYVNSINPAVPDCAFSVDQYFESHKHEPGFNRRTAYRRLVGLVDKGVLLSGKAPMPGTTRPVNHFWLNPDGPIASIETPESGASDDSGRKHA